MKQNLTVRYSVVQFSYWAAAMGAASFVTTYLLERGLSSGLIGVLLAVSGILVCLTQPFMASYADRSPKYILPQLILLLSGLCILCFALQLIPGIPVLAAGILYILGMWSSDAIHSLLNALTQVATLVAVTKLQSLVLTGRCAAGNCCTAECAACGCYFNFDGRVAARVKDLTCVNTNDLHNSKNSFKKLLFICACFPVYIQFALQIYGFLPNLKNNFRPITHLYTFYPR